MENPSPYLHDWQLISDDDILQQIQNRRWISLKYAKDIALKLKQLSFYEGYSLYYLQANFAYGAEDLFFVGNKDIDDFEKLDWTYPPIYKLNKRCPIKLNAENADDYLRFFGDFVCADEGPFTIIESLDHSRFEGVDKEKVQYPKNPDFKLPESRWEKIKPLVIEEIFEEKSGSSIEFYRTEACCWRGNNLFLTKFKIDHDGVVEMLDRLPLIAFDCPGNTTWHVPKKAPKLTKENLREYLQRYLPLRGIKLASGEIENDNYVFEDRSEFFWFTPLLPNEIKDLDKALKEFKTPEIKQDGDYLCLEVLALKGHQLRSLSIKVCIEGKGFGNRDKAGDILLEEVLGIKVEGLPDNWGYEIKVASVSGFCWVSEYIDFKREIIQEINRSLVPIIDHKQVAQIRKIKLPFYGDETFLYEIVMNKGNPSLTTMVFPVLSDGRFQNIALDWTSPLIYRMNELYGFELDKNNVADYLRFFCDFVCAVEGPFTIIEGVDHPRFEGVDKEKVQYPKNPDFELPESRWEKIKPLVIEEISEKKNGSSIKFYRTAACCWHGKKLFLAVFKIYHNGIVEMVDDQELIEFNSTGQTPWHSGDLMRVGSALPTYEKIIEKTINASEAKKLISSNKERLALPEQGIASDLPSTEVKREILNSQKSLDNSFVIGSLNLEGICLDRKLSIKDCRFRGPVDLSSLCCKGLLEIENCVFENTLTLTDAQLSGGITMRNVTVLSGLQAQEKSFVMQRASTSRVSLENVCCQQGADFSNLSVSLGFEAKNLYSTGDITFERSHISGSLDLSTIEDVSAMLLFVEGDLNLSDIECHHLTANRVTITGDLNLVGANLKGSLSIRGINVAGMCSAYNAIIEQSVNIGSFHLFEYDYIHCEWKSVRHIPTKIGFGNKESLSLYAIKVKHGYLSFSGVEITGDVDMSYASIGTGFFIRSTKEDPLRNKIDGSLIVNTLTVSKNITLEGVKIGGKLTGQMVSTEILKIFPAIIKSSKNENQLEIQCSEIAGGIDLPQCRIKKGEIAGLQVIDKSSKGFSINLKQSIVEGSLKFFTSWKEVDDRLAHVFVDGSKECSSEGWQEDNGQITNLENYQVFCRTDAAYGINLKNCKITHDLDMSCIQCDVGDINMGGAWIGGDVKIVIEEGFPEAKVTSFNADSATIGDDMDLTGLVVGSSVTAQKITVNGAFSLFKERDVRTGRSNCHTEIAGKLDLESAKKIGCLEISDDSFGLNNCCKNKETVSKQEYIKRFVNFCKERFSVTSCSGDCCQKKGIVLKQAYIERLVIFWDKEKKSYPKPVNLDYVSVDFWEFKDKPEPESQNPIHRLFCKLLQFLHKLGLFQSKNDIKQYMSFLEGNISLFQQHVYRSIEDTLLNQGREADADKIHVAMNQRILKDGLDTSIFVRCLRICWGKLTNFGTSATTLGLVFIVWLLLSSWLFSYPTYIEPSGMAWAGNSSDHKIQNNPSDGAKAWGFNDGLMMALRYHIPIVSLNIRDEWAPSNKKGTLILPLNDAGKLLNDIFKFFSDETWSREYQTPRSILSFCKYLLTKINFVPEDYATFVSIIHWIFMPIAVFIASRKLLRKRGSG